MPQERGSPEKGLTSFQNVETGKDARSFALVFFSLRESCEIQEANAVSSRLAARAPLIVVQIKTRRQGHGGLHDLKCGSSLSLWSQMQITFTSARRT